MSLEDKIRKILEDNGFPLSEEDALKFSTYLKELQRWNKVHNLTSITDEEGIVRRHFLDSLSLVKCFQDLKVEWRKKKIADAGSGAGFPGVPLKIYLKDFDLYLIEAVAKKCSFLEYLKAKLGLRWEVLCTRAEDINTKFHILVSRAMGELEDIYPVLEKLSSEYIFVLKGKEIKKEWLEEFKFNLYEVNLKELPKSYILWKKLK